MRDPLEEERKKFFFDVLLEKPLNPVVSPPVLQSGEYAYMNSTMLN